MIMMIKLFTKKQQAKHSLHPQKKNSVLSELPSLNKKDKELVIVIAIVVIVLIIAINLAIGDTSPYNMVWA